MTLLARLGLYLLDTEAVARALCSALLRDYDPNELAPEPTMDYLRTRYMRLVADYGLPPEACETVARRAWALTKRGQAPDPLSTFAFYE